MGHVENNKSLQISLLLLRLGVFLVFFMWTMDKLLRPVRQKEFLPEFGANLTPVIGILELVIVFLFLLGILKLFSYGFVFVLHLISTVSTYERYLVPFEDKNLLYFAAWPMLAACAALLLLRAEDTLFTWTWIKRQFTGNNNGE